MGKGILDLTSLNGLCEPEREAVVLSEEGIKEIWGAMKDKWREWFPTTFRDVESAELGVIKLLGELNEFGTIGTKIGELVDTDFLKHFSDLDKLSFSFKSKKEIEAAASYAKKAFSYYKELTDIRRLHRCGTMEVYDDLIECKSSGAKKFIDFVEEFSRTTVIDAYYNAVGDAAEAIKYLREGSQIRATLLATAFVDKAKKLYDPDFTPKGYLETFVRTGAGYKPGLVDHENSLLVTKNYHSLFPTLKVMSHYEAYWCVNHMLDKLEIASCDDSEQPHLLNEVTMRLVWQGFGVDFEKYLKQVIDNLTDANIAMYTIRIACKELMNLHRFILQAKVGYLEAIIRRLRAADAVVSQEGLEDLLEDERFNLNVPAQYRLAEQGQSKQAEPEPDTTLSEEALLIDGIKAFMRWLADRNKKKMPKNFDTDYTNVFEDYGKVLSDLKKIPELRKVADILDNGWLGSATQLEEIASGIGVKLEIETLCKAQISELNMYLGSQAPYIYGTVETGTKMGVFFKQFLKIANEGSDIATKLIDSQKVIKSEGGLQTLVDVIDTLYGETEELFGKVDTDFPFEHFWESLETSVRKHTVAEFADDLLSGKFGHLSVRGKNANTVLGGVASVPWGLGEILYTVGVELKKHEKYVKSLSDDEQKSIAKIAAIEHMLGGLETCQYTYYDFLFDEIEIVSVRGATKVGLQLLNEFENNSK